MSSLQDTTPLGDSSKATTKVCNVCHQEKLIIEFPHIKGICKGAQCIECRNAATRLYRQKKAEQARADRSNPEAQTVPKTCYACKQTKTVADFNINKGICKECRKIEQKKEREEAKQKMHKLAENPEAAQSLTKTCTVCGITKPVLDFYARGGQCKECRKANQRGRRVGNVAREQAIISNPESASQPKTCIRCGATKTVVDFVFNRRVCKDCDRELGRQYNKDHPEIRQRWRDANKEHLAKIMADWYQKNKATIRVRSRQRYANDAYYRFYHTIKTTNQHKITGLLCGKDHITSQNETFYEWFDMNFQDEMNWENHGTVWDIDHVIPANMWDIENPDHIRICNSWLNLTPVDCHYNRNTKRDKFDEEQWDQHIEMLDKFFKDHPEIDSKVFGEYLCMKDILVDSVSVSEDDDTSATEQHDE